MSRHDYFFAPAVIGIAIGASPLSAESATAPGLTPAEQTAMCLIDAALDAAATVVETQNCSATAGLFDVKVEAFDDGHGWVTVDGATLRAKLSRRAESSLCQITGADKGYIDNVEVRRYQGTSRFADVDGGLSGDSELLVGADAIQQQLAKNFKISKSVSSDPEPQTLRVDSRGTTEIAIPDLPPAKWQHTAKYSRPGSRDGRIQGERIQIESDSGAGCRIVFSASVDNLAGGFQSFGGRLEVTQD